MNQSSSVKGWVLVVAAGMAALAVFGWIMYDLGRYSVMEDFTLKTTGYKPIVGPGALKDEVEQLRTQLSSAQRDLAIDRSANKRLQKDLAETQVKLVELREELNFYRRIVAPEKVAEPVQIYAATIVPAEKKGVYNVELTLIQAKKRRTTIGGSVRLVIAGQEGAKESSMVVTKSNGKLIKYGYKYFQRLSFEITIPDNFTPESVQVKMTPRVRSMHDVVQQNYEWKNLVAKKDKTS